jgi:hypothetical protein
LNNLLIWEKSENNKTELRKNSTLKIVRRKNHVYIGTQKEILYVLKVKRTVKIPARIIVVT